MPPPVEDIAAQAQPQDLQYVDMGYYNIAHSPPPQGHRDHIIGDNAGIVQGVPVQAAPPAPVCTTLIFVVYIYLTIPSTKGD